MSPLDTLQKNLEHSPSSLTPGKFQRFGKNNSSWAIMQEWEYKGKQYWSMNYGDWKTDSKFSAKSWDDKSLTTTDKTNFTKILKQKNIESEQIKLSNKQAFANKWATSFPKLPLATQHTYLTKKNVMPYNTRISGNTLVIPGYMDNEIVAIQTISNNTKKFEKGSSMKGAFFPLQPIGDNKKCIVAEGFATAASIQQALPNVPCIVAFNAGNLLEACKQIRKYKPNVKITIAADNDKSNTGIAQAEKVKNNLSNIAIAMPNSLGDFNDHPGEIEIKFNPISPMIKYNDQQYPEDICYTDEENYEDYSDNLLKKKKKGFNPTSSTNEIWEQCGVATEPNGKATANEHTAYLLLKNSEQLKDRFYFDSFLGEIMVRVPNNKPRPLQDTDITTLLIQVQGELEISRIKQGHIANALTLVAEENKTNSAQDWINSITWDKQTRIETTLVTMFGAEQTPLNSRIFRKWMISLVARIMSPGCKVDTLPVFKGFQGRKKSTALKALASADWFAETSDSMDSKDFKMLLVGKLIVEIAELGAFTKTGLAAIKNIITTQTDKIRLPYGHNMVELRRTAVFAGTTNDDQYLKDSTGNRRYLPIEVFSTIDEPGIKQFRDQFFAEALTYYNEKEDWWEFGDLTNELLESQKAVYIEDIMTDTVLTYCEEYVVSEKKNNPLTTLKIAIGAFNLSHDVIRCDRKLAIRVANIMRSNDWKYTEGKTYDRRSVKCWIPPIVKSSPENKENTVKNDDDFMPF